MNNDMNTVRVGEVYTYQSDDKDEAHEATLIGYTGGNGDYYLAVQHKDMEGVTQQSPAVRICTSGGCSTTNPDLLHSAADVVKSMAGVQTGAKTMLKELQGKLDFAIALMERALEGEKVRDDIQLFVDLNS